MNPNPCSLSKTSIHISIEGQISRNLPGIIGRFGVQKEINSAVLLSQTPELKNGIKTGISFRTVISYYLI